MRIAALLALAAIVLTAGCSSDNPASASRPAPTTETMTLTTTASTSTPEAVANPVTTRACRAFADNTAVNIIRDALVNGSDSASTADVADAFNAVFDLEITAVTPGLDPNVAAAMNLASQQSAAQHDVWVDTAQLDPVPFDRMVTGVDTTCETAGVDMS